MSVWATKPVAVLLNEADGSGHRALKRTLGPLNLTMLGIGAIVGAGIFVLTGVAAAQNAGPAVPISMILVGIACGFAGLCYAEMASAVPVAGSAYTYAYATLGEIVAWIIGWDLILEYAMGAATVGVGWSATFVSLLDLVGVRLPASITNAPFVFCTSLNVMQDIAGCTSAGWHLTGAIVNAPAIAIVAAISLVLVIGIRESASFNSWIVVVKVGVLVLFVTFGIAYVNADNWRPFIPPNAGEWGTYGWSGVFRGAGLIFFAFIGFDAVSTAAQESKNPQKDMPRSILGSLAICTLLYIAVSIVLTGLVHYTELDVASPVVTVVEKVPQLAWLRPAVTIGAVVGMGSTLLVMLLGQSRVLYSMSRDGLIGEWAGRVHPRFRTPYLSTIYTGVGVAIFTGLFPIQILGQLVNIGTLLAFVIVCAGVWVLRRTRPDLDRPFRTPAVSFVASAGIVCCLALMLTLPLDTWIRLAVWLLLGLGIYFGYGRRRSRLSTAEAMSLDHQP